MQGLWYLQQCCWFLKSSGIFTVLTVNISKNYSAVKFGIKHFKTSWSCKCLMTVENLLWSWGYRGLVHWNKPLVHLIWLPQRIESCKVMNQLFKVCTWCRHSYTSDRKFARSDMLWHILMFQLMELLYSFQDINKWNACIGIIQFKLLYALAHDFLVTVATWILNDVWQVQQ